MTPQVIYVPGGPPGPLHEREVRARDNPRAQRGRVVEWKPLGELQHLRATVCVVRDEDYDPDAAPWLGTPRETATWLAGVESMDREVFLSILLDARHRIIAVDEVAKGSLISVNVHPRELFRTAIVLGATRLLVVHNHPASGDPEPSPEDLTLTSLIQEIGQLIGIPLMDHIIIGHRRFVSLRDRGVIR